MARKGLVTTMKSMLQGGYMFEGTRLECSYLKQALKGTENLQEEKVPLGETVTKGKEGEAKLVASRKRKVCLPSHNYNPTLWPYLQAHSYHWEILLRIFIISVFSYLKGREGCHTLSNQLS